MPTCTPTAAECATARTQLAEAQNAWHALMTGAKTASIAFNGKQVTYAPTSRGALAQHIEQLKRIVARCDGVCRTPRTMIGIIPTN